MRGALAIAAGVLLLSPTGLAAEAVPGQVNLGDTAIAGWLATAWINVGRSDDPPVIDNVLCEIEAEDRPIRFTTTRDGGLWLQFTDGDDLNPREIRFLKIGGTTWEYRHHVFEWGEDHFADVDYPPPPPPPEPCGGLQGHDIILYGCSQAIEGVSRLVRRSAADPWLGLDTLANELLEAKAVRIVYHAEHADAADPLRETEVSLQGLREALAWCDEITNSEAAKRLHAVGADSARTRLGSQAPTTTGKA